MLLPVGRNRELDQKKRSARIKEGGNTDNYEEG